MSWLDREGLTSFDVQLKHWPVCTCGTPELDGARGELNTACRSNTMFCLSCGIYANFLPHKVPALRLYRVFVQDELLRTSVARYDGADWKSIGTLAARA